MPGLLGFTYAPGSDPAHSLEKGLALLRYGASYRTDPSFRDGLLAAGRTHLGIVGDASSPATQSSLFCWVEGEWYNTRQVDDAMGLNGSSLANRILRCYREGRLAELLSRVDGLFCAALYDQEKQTLLLLTDRLGIKPLYFWEKYPHFGWCSELKGFLPLEHFHSEIDAEALACFWALGYIAGDRTWFKGVLQVPAATILTYDLKRKKISHKERYWSWASIRKQQIPFSEATEILATLLRQAVERRSIRPDVKPLGVSLSGGLDSRLILSCLRPETLPVLAFTFGKSGCRDIDLARRVARRKEVDHLLLELNEENWLNGRLEGVWKSDAMTNMMHLHLSPHHHRLEQQVSVNLNGFLGDLTVKGLFVSMGPNQRVDTHFARKHLGSFAHFDPPEDPFYDFPGVDPYLINNSQRKRNAAASAEWSKHVEQRNPWTDQELLEFLYSLPDAYRIYHRLHLATVNEFFPELFRDIPWQRIGIAVRRQRLARFLLRIHWYGVLRRLPWLKHYDDTHYAFWLRTPSAARLLSPLLRREGSIYKDYLAVDFYQAHWLPHQQNRSNQSERILRAATLEYWLRALDQFSGKSHESRPSL